MAKKVIIATNTTFRKPSFTAGSIHLTEENMDQSKYAIEKFIEWIKNQSNSTEIILLYVIQKELIDFSKGYLEGDYYSITDFKKIVKEKALKDAKQYLDEIKELCIRRGLRVSTKIREGESAKEIVREAKEANAYTILLQMNSLTYDIVKSSPCPVMIFPAAKELSILQRIQRVFKAPMDIVEAAQ